MHITNRNNGNIKVGSVDDFVLGAFNDSGVEPPTPSNRHSSGIVAFFSQGVDSCSLFDTDNDTTTKSLFAFDASGSLIFQSAAANQITFSVNTSQTVGNALIHSIEFDTLAGTAGGSFDGTFFTIDNVHIEFEPIPEPSSLALLSIGAFGLFGYGWQRKRKQTFSSH